jgi:unsaturated rhamnogalacturonyl hydrolase
VRVKLPALLAVVVVVVVGCGHTGSGAAGSAAGASAASTAPLDRGAVASIMRRVADHEIARFGTTIDNGWVRATFHTGLLAAYRALGEARYRDYTMRWAEANHWLVSTDDESGPRFADNQACFQSYVELYAENPVASNRGMIASGQSVFDAMIAAPEPGRVEWWWEDALYMAPPALARLAKVTGKAAYLTLLDQMYWDTKAYLFDPATSLFWRDKNFLGQNVYWSRGNGWVFAGLARLLQALPANAARRADYETLFRQLATKLQTLQASDGYWRSSLTQPDLFPNPETSGTAFFCFGMAWGINNGLLDRATYLPTVTKAWNALVAAVSADGRLGWVQVVAAKPGPTNMTDTNDYASGALLLAGGELLAL